MVKTAYLHITSRCNLACAYCYLDAAYDECSAARWSRALTQLADAPPQKIVVTGGEPLLHEGVFEIAVQCKKLMPEVFLQLMTNGLLVGAGNAGRFAVFDEVRISIDGKPEYADALRGQGTTAKAAEARFFLERAGIPVAASVTVAPYEDSTVRERVEQVRQMGFADIHVHPLKAVGRAKNALLSGEPCSALPDCGKGRYLNVLPDGSAYPCHVLLSPDYCLGNIFIDGYESIVRKLSQLASSPVIP